MNPPPVYVLASQQFKGNAWARFILRLFGWKVLCHGLPKGGGVLIAYPHTSNWDFVLGLLAHWAIGIPMVFLGKDSLFKIPIFGRIMRYWGGVPVERTEHHGMIDQMAKLLQSPEFKERNAWFALAPEGTRKYTPYWRSGFYYMTFKANVPLGLAYFNYERKEVGLTHFLMLTGNIAADLNHISQYYAEKSLGLYPDKAAPVFFKEE